MSKSVIMLSQTTEGHIIFTGMITKDNLDTMPQTEFKLLTDDKTSMSDKLLTLATYFEERVDTGTEQDI